MKKYTQKELKRIAKSIAVIDLTNDKEHRGLALTKVGYSSGQYGINGALFVDNVGQEYVITSRTPAIFVY